jgi:hypothetical protein
MPGAARECQPRKPEESLLYVVVAEELETFLAGERERGHDIPGFVETEFRAFLDCGILARGLIRVHCDACGLDRVVGFSCKRRGWCPSCCGRRMADTAAHLVDRVLNLHTHAHMLVLDGVYAALEGEAPRFYPLHAPEEKDVAWVAAEVAARTGGLLERLGQSSADGEQDRLSCDDPWLSGLYAASVSGRVATGTRAGRRVQTAGVERNPEEESSASGPRCANVAGFSVHANVAIREHRRDALERLCRYMCRPPLAIDRLGRLPDGRLTYRMKTPWRDGTTHVVFSPSEFLEKLAVLVPAPRAHLVTFHGVLAPAAKWRPQIVPAIDQSPETVADGETGCAQDQEPEKEKPRHRRNYTWAELMKRVWAIDVLECPRCSGRMRLVAAIHAEEALHRILECLGLPSRAPPLSPARRSDIVSTRLSVTANAINAEVCPHTHVLPPPESP